MREDEEQSSCEMLKAKRKREGGGGNLGEVSFREITGKAEVYNGNKCGGGTTAGWGGRVGVTRFVSASSQMKSIN